MDRKRFQEEAQGAVWIFEGPDGVGKSTLIENVTEKLSLQHIKVLTTSFPGKNPNHLGNLVYNLHHTPELFDIERITPTSLQLLHIAAHIECIHKEIIPAIEKGFIVLLDRYWWSTWVYGICSGVPKSVLRKMIEIEKKSWINIPIKKIFLINSPEPFQLSAEPSRWQEIDEEYKKLSHSPLGGNKVEYLSNQSGMLAPVIEKVTSMIVSNEKTPQCALNIINYAIPAKPTKVYDAYWHFAAERQEIFFKRIKQEPAPWTTDSILQEFKFTNAYRASDRVSQYLIKNVIYDKDSSQSPDEVFFRILIFKIFNKISTWEILKKDLGKISYSDYSFDRYDSILKKAIDSGKRIYSAAYIMPSGISSFGCKYKHQNNLQLIAQMIKDNIPSKITRCKTMKMVFELLRCYPTLGNFLAYQFATDLNYSNMINFDEMSFVVPGPGALNGLRKCFSSFGELSEEDIIKRVAEKQELEFTQRGIKFKTLCGRQLQLIDCQNIFCEIDKYSRVAYPEFHGQTKKTRIKQRFCKNSIPIEYWYPPKWNINEHISRIQNGTKAVYDCI